MEISKRILKFLQNCIEYRKRIGGEMNKKIMSVLMLLILAFSVWLLPGVSAKPEYLTEYQKQYTDGSCDTCHTTAPALNTYGDKVKAELDKPVDIETALKTVGPAPGDRPIPELPTVVLFGVSLIGLLSLVHYRKNK